MQQDSTVIVFVSVSVSLSVSVTFKLTVFEPPEIYVTVCGPAVFAVAGLAPVPKFHKYANVPSPPVEELVKITCSKVPPVQLLLDVKLTAKGVLTIIVLGKSAAEHLLPPPLSFAHPGVTVVACPGGEGCHAK